MPSKFHVLTLVNINLSMLIKFKWGDLTRFTRPDMTVQIIALCKSLPTPAMEGLFPRMRPVVDCQLGLTRLFFTASRIRALQQCHAGNSRVISL